MFGLGVLLQRGLLNRVIGKGPMPPLLITFRLSIILQNVLLLTFSADSRRLTAGPLETLSIRIGGLSLGVLPLLTFAGTVAILIGLKQLMNRTALGRAFRATSDDPVTSELMGIDSKRVYGLALGLALALVAVAGVLFGMRTIFAPPTAPAA